MYTFVMFPFMLFFPVLSYKYFIEYLGNRSLKCECSFISDTEIKTWESFVVKFNYLENKSQTYKFIELMNKFVCKYDLDYNEDVHINATYISLRIPNENTHSFNMVVDLLNSTEICLINKTTCEVNHTTDEEDESSDDDEYNDEESDEDNSSSSDKDTNEEKDEDETKEEFDFAELIDKMIGSIIDDSIVMSCEKTMKSMLSEVTKLQNYEVTDTEDIQEDSNTEEPSAVVESNVVNEPSANVVDTEPSDVVEPSVTEQTKEEVTNDEKTDEMTTSTDTDEFELIKSV